VTVVSTYVRSSWRSSAFSAGVRFGFGKRVRIHSGTPEPLENGGTLPQKSVWPFTGKPLSCAQAISESASENENASGVGCTTRHFIPVSMTTKFACFCARSV
jgi:hypothetical protein